MGPKRPDRSAGRPYTVRSMEDRMLVEHYLEQPGPYPLRRVVETEQGPRRARRAMEQLNYAAYRDARALSSIYVRTLTKWASENVVQHVVGDKARLAGLETTMVPVGDRHEHFFSTGAGTVDPRLLAHMRSMRSDTPERWAFVSWYLLNDWFETIFTKAVFGRDGEPMTVVKEPKLWAMPFADVALTMLRERGDFLTAGLAAQMLAASREEPWGPPPWHSNP